MVLSSKEIPLRREETTSSLTEDREQRPFLYHLSRLALLENFLQDLIT